LQKKNEGSFLPLSFAHDNNITPKIGIKVTGYRPNIDKTLTDYLPIIDQILTLLF